MYLLTLERERELSFNYDRYTLILRTLRVSYTQTNRIKNNNKYKTFFLTLKKKDF